MNDTKMMPEHLTNAIAPGPLDASGNIKGEPSRTVAALVIPEYQCIVCKYTRKSPTEVHQHQIHFHSTEELSLSIIGLQVLYNMHRTYKEDSADENNTAKTESNNLELSQQARFNNEESGPLALSMEAENLTYPRIQEEPMCLKILKSNSSPNIQAKNSGIELNLNKNQKIAAKKSQLKIPSAKVKKLIPLIQRNTSKVVRILPALPKLTESTIQSRSRNNSIGIGNVTNFNKRDEDHCVDQTFKIEKERSNVPQDDPVCLKVLQKTEKIIIQKSENFRKPQTFLKIPKEELEKSEVTIEKIKSHFKIPEVIIKKKPAVIIQKLEIIKQPEDRANVDISKYQIKVESPKVKSENLASNVNNLCCDKQKAYFERSCSKSSLQQLESSLQNLGEIQEPLHKLESSFQTPESLRNFESPLQTLITPEFPIQNHKLTEKPQKKFKPSLELAQGEEIRNEMIFQGIQIPPLVEVVDDGMYDSIREKLYMGSELPTDITKIAMQDFPNLQNSDIPQNDFSNQVFMNLNSYLMPETQPLDGYDSYSQSIKFVDNETSQNLNYLTVSNEVPGYDYSSLDDSTIMNNQRITPPTNPNEAWMNVEANPIYTELLPVFYH